MCIAQYTPFIFSQAYHIVRPSKAPGFSYAWLELISHRVFIAKLLLQTTQQKVQRIVFITVALFWYMYMYIPIINTYTHHYTSVVHVQCIVYTCTSVEFYFCFS